MLSPANPAYLEAISDAPADDDGPRLVFADWLQEHGHSWGELIAVQCSLAHVAPATLQRATLLRREHELLADRSWWPYDGSGFHVETFVRGFPGRIRAGSAAGLRTLATRMPWMPDAENIVLTLAEGDMLGLAAMERLPTRGFSFVSDPAYFFDLLDAKLFVHWLERHALRLRRFGYQGMARPTALEAVLATPLAQRVLEDVEVSHVFGVEAYRDSRRLDLDAWLAPVQSLRSVTLADHDMGARGEIGPRLEAFAETARLTTFDSERDALVRKVARLTRIRRLDLSDRRLDDGVVAEVLEHAAPTLRRLALAKNRITRATVERVIAMPGLTELELWSTPLGDDGAALLAQTRCEALELVNTGMTEEGAHMLAASTTLPPTLRLTVSAAEAGAVLPALRERFAVVIAR